MKLSKLAPVLLAVGLLAAQTGIRVDQILPTEPGEIIVVTGTGFFPFGMAELGPGFYLDTSSRPYVLRHTPERAIKDRTAYEVAGPTTEFIVPVDFAPGSLEIHRQGMLMTAPYDYTLTGRTIEFVTAQIPQAGDIVNLQYFPAPF